MASSRSPSRFSISRLLRWLGHLLPAINLSGLMVCFANGFPTAFELLTEALFPPARSPKTLAVDYKFSFSPLDSLPRSPVPLEFRGLVHLPLKTSPSALYSISPFCLIVMTGYSCIDITFSDECAEHYWPPEYLASVPSQPKAPSIDEEVEFVLTLLRTRAPHVAGSFACKESWWKKHWGSPEAHVSSGGNASAFSGFVIHALSDVQVPPFGRGDGHSRHIQQCPLTPLDRSPTARRTRQRRGSVGLEARQRGCHYSAI